MMKKFLTISVLMALFLNSCKETKKTEIASETNIEVFGMYEGTSPGANSLIKETLSLHSDNTFIKTLVYLDKGNEKFVSKGAFKIDSGKIILDIDHEKESGYYKVFDEYLLQLDITGKEIATENIEMTEMYKMKKIKN